MINLLYLTFNRLEFTKASLAALIANTDWNKVSRLMIYDDESTDGTAEYLRSAQYPITPEFRFGHYGSPVSVMNDYLCSRSPMERQIFGKIDSDTMVPPGWLNECLTVMHHCPGLDLLGIEAMNPVASSVPARGYIQANYIGGIGLMRSASFVTLPRPNGRFGFTDWQEKNPHVVKGWINPSLPVFLLDRLPREPWQTLSKQYIERNWQRHWGQYEEKNKDQWSWWCE